MTTQSNKTQKKEKKIHSISFSLPNSVMFVNQIIIIRIKTFNNWLVHTIKRKNALLVYKQHTHSSIMVDKFDLVFSSFPIFFRVVVVVVVKDSRDLFSFIHFWIFRVFKFFYIRQSIQFNNGYTHRCFFPIKNE